MFREVSPPFVAPITLAELKLHLRTSPTLAAAEDVQLASIIEAATRYAENYCGRPFVPRVVELVVQTFPSKSNEAMGLGVGSVQQVIAVSYRDPAGAAQTVAPLSYRLLSGDYEAWLLPSSNFGWPQTDGARDAVTIRMVAGFPSELSPEGAEGVPRSIKQAILMICGDMYENREAIIVGTIRQENEAVHRLLHFYRVELP